MGSAAPRLADWRAAAQVGRRVAGPGFPVPAVERARLREDLSELVPHAESLILGFTGLSLDGSRSRPWVMSRGEWIDQNLQALQRLLEPLAARMLAPRASRSELRRKALGAQVGLLLGYVSRKVLGQYDVFVPPDDEGTLYFVGPNVAEMERRFRLPPRDFRLWIALHETCHRVQFGAAPWLRAHLQRLVDEYFDTISLDGKELLRQLRRGIEEARTGAIEWRGVGILFLLMSPEQRDLFGRMQALMSLLEGHASYVMNVVAAGRVHDLERMRRALKERRRAPGLERAFQQAIGFESKIRQYGSGERFVRETVELAGMEGFNRVWSGPANLPTLAEVSSPARWVERVAGG
jgi:coenzyme F420 biosynthesis associated uncharacterized protein